MLTMTLLVSYVFPGSCEYQNNTDANIRTNCNIYANIRTNINFNINANITIHIYMI